MINQPVATVGMTPKPFTLVVQCCDPPLPVCYMHSKSLKRLKDCFDGLVADEKENGVVGGSEFSFLLYKHNLGSAVKVMVNDDDFYANFPYVYNLDFTDSEVLHEFNYMDLMGED